MAIETMRTCCICGVALPNRYSIGGVCEEEGCDAHFCKLHWNISNHRCPEHGYQEVNFPKRRHQATKKEAQKNSEPTQDQTTPMPDEKPKLTKETSKKLMKETVGLLKKMGSGAAELIKRLRKVKNPEEMMAEMEKHLDENRTRRESVSNRLETLHHSIAKKKAEFQKTSAARQRVLKLELQSMMQEYQSVERTLKVLLENERGLSLVKSRLEEVVAYGLSGLTDEFIDTVTDQVEDAVDMAEDNSDALSDLEKAGRRRERENSEEDFLSQLDQFGDEDFDLPEENAVSDFETRSGADDETEDKSPIKEP